VGCGARQKRWESKSRAGFQIRNTVLIDSDLFPLYAGNRVGAGYYANVRFCWRINPVILCVNSASFAGQFEEYRAKEDQVADTTKIEDKLERKKLKRAARKKAAPKAKRTEPRGSKKRKVKKMARGQTKR